MSFFTGKENAAVKYFTFKLFKHCPDGMDTFKRHIDLEHGVHNKRMFDYDQRFSRLKCKTVSVDVFVNL